MDDFLTSMWNNLSMSKNEAITLNIDSNKLSTPKNAFVGKLAMKKHVSPFEVHKGLKSLWDVVNKMETTAHGENLICCVLDC